MESKSWATCTIICRPWRIMNFSRSNRARCSVTLGREAPTRLAMSLWLKATRPTALVEGVVGIPFREFSEALNLTVGRWWALLERHSNFLSQTVREKIMLALFDLGRKFGQRDDHAMIIDLGLSGQDIADLVESSRPKVSECLKQLVAEGVVTRERRRFIIDPAKIQASLRS